MQYPAGWNLTISEEGIITIQDPESIAVLWPLYSQRNLEHSSASKLLQELASRFFPGQQWESAQWNEGGFLFTKTNSPETSGKAALSWANGTNGSLVYFWVTGAPLDKYARLEDIFATCFASFYLIPEPENKKSQNPADKYSYLTFTDPDEKSFSLEMPEGWLAEGGLHRASSIDTRSFLRLFSPDREIYIFMGDREIPYYTLPVQTLAWTGYREGSWYTPGYGNYMMVMRYKPGVVFAEEYTRNMAANFIQFAIEQKSNRSDIAQNINRIYQQYNMGIYQQADAGEIYYSFYGNQKYYSGYTFAFTTLASAYGGGIWHVDYLYGFQAPAGRVEEAEKVLTRMINSIRINPQWMQMQQNITANVSGIVAETSAYISDIVQQSFENAQRVQDESFRKYSNFLRGVEDVRDPATGRDFQIKSGNNYYWIDNLGEITGTNLYENPDISRFREMVRLD